MTKHYTTLHITTLYYTATYLLHPAPPCPGSPWPGASGSVCRAGPVGVGTEQRCPRRARAADAAPVVGIVYRGIVYSIYGIV